jgi:hypothetical protein
MGKIPRVPAGPVAERLGRRPHARFVVCTGHAVVRNVSAGDPLNLFIRRVKPLRMDRAQLEAEIRAAFRGVVLGNGISLGQAQVIDRTGDGFSDDELAALLPEHEVKNDWSQISYEELDSDCLLT